jgi:hypothetical protein
MPQVLQAKGEANSVSDQQNQLKEEFERLLEETLQQKYEQGDIVKGDVVRVERDGVLVDVGAKSEGFVPQKDAAVTPVVTPVETPDLSSTRLKQTDFNAQDLTPQGPAPTAGQAPSQSMLEQPSIVP